MAREFRDLEFYFPHNLDFRGRAYPIPPHLNHMGSDVCRGLLKFAGPLQSTLFVAQAGGCAGGMEGPWCTWSAVLCSVKRVR